MIAEERKPRLASKIELGDRQWPPCSGEDLNGLHDKSHIVKWLLLESAMQRIEDGLAALSDTMALSTLPTWP